MARRTTNTHLPKVRQWNEFEAFIRAYRDDKARAQFSPKDYAQIAYCNRMIAETKAEQKAAWEAPE